MKKGIVYVMTTAIPGVSKIGSTETKQYKERMRHLEKNGYNNIAGLKRCFAIEVENYKEKESLLHSVFSKQRLGDSECFAIQPEILQELLLAFKGNVVFPENINQEEVFKEVAETRVMGIRFSFYRKGIKKGSTISFVEDPNIKVKVVGEREVEYEGKVWKLSPLVALLMERIGKRNPSGAYQGANYFTFQGERLTKIEDM